MTALVSGLILLAALVGCSASVAGQVPTAIEGEESSASEQASQGLPDPDDGIVIQVGTGDASVDVQVSDAEAELLSLQSSETSTEADPHGLGDEGCDI